MPGFPGVVLIPLGRLQTSPIPLLARGALLPRHLHPRTGDIHGRPKRRAEIRCQFIILARKEEGNPVSIHHSCPKRGSDTGLRARKSGVNSSFLPEKRKRHRITREEIRCQFIILARKEEATPDYARKEEATPDYARGNPVSIHHSCPKRGSDTGLRVRRERRLLRGSDLARVIEAVCSRYGVDRGQLVTRGSRSPARAALAYPLRSTIPRPPAPSSCRSLASPAPRASLTCRRDSPLCSRANRTRGEISWHWNAPLA